jgi:hypothetical protein
VVVQDDTDPVQFFDFWENIAGTIHRAIIHDDKLVNQAGIQYAFYDLFKGMQFIVDWHQNAKFHKLELYQQAKG